MDNVDAEHESISNYLVSLNNNNKIVNSNDDVSNKELVTVYKYHVNLF